MEFKEFNAKLRAHVLDMTEGETHLFETDVSKDEMWETYLESFPPGTNEIFRERREFDCNCCKHTIRILGNVVAVKYGKIITVWDFDTGSEKYQPVVDAMAELIRSRPIRGVFLTPTRKIGTEKNYDNASAGPILWYHLYAELGHHVELYRESEIPSLRGEFASTRGVLWRSFVELKETAIDTVQDLIAQRSLYKGEEWEQPIKIFRESFDMFWKLDDDEQEGFVWKEAIRLGPAIAKIRNHSIGVLLRDISNDMDLNEAVKRYEKIVAPTNYKRPKPIFIKQMVEDAQRTVLELGFESSLGRRFAQLEDITVPNILFADRSAVEAMTGGVFEELAESVPQKAPNFDRIEEVPIDTFVEKVLPTAEGLELYLSGEHEPNLVSLVAPKEIDSPSMFKWDNSFSWAYKGNITDSMRERVKRAGGTVDGVLRFSIQWNDEGDCNDDLDAHAQEPNGNIIYYPNKGQVHLSSGMLDVDIIEPKANKRAVDGVAVENIIYTDRGRMPKGSYAFLVHCYTSRGGKSGFTAEIEFGGQIHRFEHPSPLVYNQKVVVAQVYYDGETFSLKEHLSSSLTSKTVWGLNTNRFHPVSVMMYSPNYWDQQTGIGHRHFMFMLRGCVNDEGPSGFFNEFLNQSLAKHRKVFEALSSKMRVADTDRQLSGLGFSATKRASVIVKVKGSFQRVIKLIF
jgi:hypothetical protein